jgi:hypothetical protein
MRSKFELPENLIQKIKAQAQESGKSPSEVVNEIICASDCQISDMHVGHINLSIEEAAQAVLAKYQEWSAVTRAGVVYPGSKHRALQTALEKYFDKCVKNT